MLRKKSYYYFKFHLLATSLLSYYILETVHFHIIPILKVSVLNKVKIYVCVYMYYMCVLIILLRIFFEYLTHANMNVIINKPDKGQNIIKLYIVMRLTCSCFSLASYQTVSQPYNTIASTSTACLPRFESYCDLTALENSWSIFSPFWEHSLFFLSVWFPWWKCAFWKSKDFSFISFYFSERKWNDNSNITLGISLFLKSCGLSLTDKIFCCQDLPSILYLLSDAKHPL